MLREPHKKYVLFLWISYICLKKKPIKLDMNFSNDHTDKVKYNFQLKNVPAPLIEATPHTHRNLANVF